MKLLLHLLLVSFALQITAGTIEEKFVPLYYQQIKKGDFNAAKNVLGGCKYERDCDHFKVMHEALLQAMSQKDVSSTRWICSELKKEEEWRDTLEQLNLVAGLTAMGVGIIAILCTVGKAVENK